jgi:hypothetical protein
MSEILKVPQTNQSSEHKDKYFNFQIKGWVNFDPMDKTLARVAEGIEQGNGFLTLVDVLNVEDDVAAIEDEEVRGCFENLLAAKRLIQNVNELPAKVKEDLRAALSKTEEEITSKRIVPMVSVPPVNEETGSRVKRWP